MGIVHAGIHTLSGLGGVRVASITSDKNAFVDGKLGRDPLTNCVLQLGTNPLRIRGKERRTDVNCPPIDLSGDNCVGPKDLLSCLKIQTE